MRFPNLFILLTLLLQEGNAVFAQVTKSPRTTNYKIPNVSRSKARNMCPIFVESDYPYQGIGMKLGDPFALTYKYYPNKHWAFAVDAGKAASGLYNKYYRNLFSSYLMDPIGGEQSKYLSHKVNSDWFLETKFLYQWDAEKISKGLQLYAGLGWQWKRTSLQYQYLDQNSQFGKLSVDRFTYGPVIALGFEYSYFSLPISSFIEIEWFTDTLLDPGYQRFQGGVGLRYVF